MVIGQEKIPFSNSVGKYRYDLRETVSKHLVVNVQNSLPM